MKSSVVQQIRSSWRVPRSNAWSWGGVSLALGSTLCFSLVNLSTRLLVSEQWVAGVGVLGGWVKAGISTALPVLAIRMLVVVPGMVLLSPGRARGLGTGKQRQTVIRLCVAAGFVLLGSQLTMYLCLERLSAGVATTLFFVYPVVTVVAQHAQARKRLSLRVVLGLSGLMLGIFLTTSNWEGAMLKRGLPVSGVLLACGSGVLFGAYMLLAQATVKRSTPQVFSLFSSLSLLIGVSTASVVFFDAESIRRLFQVEAGALALWLGVLSLGAFFLNAKAVAALKGSDRVAVLGAFGPILTLAGGWLLFANEPSVTQKLGGLLVSLCVLWLVIAERSERSPAR